jgi:hypothetical protein
MSKRAFEQFLSSRKQPTTPEWEAHKERWLQAVDGLYAQVEGWLGEYIQALAVVCQREPRRLAEDGIGQYEVQALRIRCQGIDVALEPIGANIIGAFGRVDLVGPAGNQRLLRVLPDRSGPRVRIRRVDEQAVEAQPAPVPEPEPVFKLATEPPAVRYLDLDQDVFLDALMYVMGARMQAPGE